MRGIVLAGGTGSRLYPATKSVSKQLLPVYDKPMIYYPVSILMLAGITEILVITTPRDLEAIQESLDFLNGCGMRISFKVQTEPRGIAEAFLIGSEFIGNEKVMLILGDNFFYGSGLIELLTNNLRDDHAKIFAYHVNNPSEYGVVKFDHHDKPIEIVEKPKDFVSNYAIPGVYIYPPNVTDKAKNLVASQRGEIEITELNNMYLDAGTLDVGVIPRGVAWMDMGRPDDLLNASNFVHNIESRQGLKIACLEEIIWRRGFVTLDVLTDLIHKMPPGRYQEDLLALITIDLKPVISKQ